MDSTKPPLGYFVIHEMEHNNIYQCTKFKVSIYTHSRFRKGPKIKK